MNRFIIIVCCVVLSSFLLNSQYRLTPDSSMRIPEIHIKSTRANDRFLSTYSFISAKQIASLSLSQDVPYVLQSVPSLSYCSDAGNAVGYTNLSIRGSDAQRIQVNINGVPYNDPESHEVYWVNIPDIMSNTDDIQIQRGVGFSTTGGTSFGGLISIKTTKKYAKPATTISTAIGSFNTRKVSVMGTTGCLDDGWQATARVSYIASDGYIDRASTDLKSMYMALSHYGNKWNTQLIAFTGNEKTYQAWYGVNETDFNAGNLTKNIAGTDYEQKSGDPYPNQIDNYTQTNIQWINNYMWTPNVNSSFSTYLTKGKGFYEEYKVQAKYNDYQLNSSESGDLVRQLWLDNYLIGTNLTHSISKTHWENTLSLSWNTTIGAHYGKVAHIVSDPKLYTNDPYYYSKARKYDLTLFNKWAYFIGKSTLVVDLQLRNVSHLESGTSANGYLDFDRDFLFFNPKLGLNYALNQSFKYYIFGGIGQKEPNRNDLIDATSPQSEMNINLELGQIITKNKWHLESNLYAMYYKNQLIFKGNLNEVGASIRENVPTSYRMGIENSFSIQLSNDWKFSTNQSLAMHKILDYIYIIPTYNEDYTVNKEQSISTYFNSTDIALSPQWISFVELCYSPTPNLIFKMNNKTVSKQYLDNTSDDSKSIPTYSFINFIAEYDTKIKGFKNLKFNLLLNNILETKVSTRGYTYNSGNSINSTGIVTKGQDYNYYFPQAGFNFMIGMKVEI